MTDFEHVNYASVNLTNLIYNYNKIKNIITPPSGVICVVKADAYGHGIEHCAAALYETGARKFAVATLTEAVELRNLIGDEADILIMGYTPCKYADVLSCYNIVQTIYSPDYAIELNKYALNPIRVHIKVNTGMHRLGFDSAEDIKSIKQLNKLIYEGIYTHFACSDEPLNTMTMNQYKKFTDIIGKCGIDFKIRHAANSGAILNFPETHLNAVRAGIILYGLNGNPNDTNIMKPVLTLVSTVSHIHNVRKGDTIGYGATFTAPHDMKIITISIGYADGFIRAYNKGKITVNGKLLSVTGRICMDQFMADATDLDVKVGDRVYLFGDDAIMKTEDYAELADTINYETVCTISKRVPRLGFFE